MQSFVLASALLSVQADGPPEAPRLRRPTTHDSIPLDLGSCRAGETSFNLGPLMVLENRAIETDGPRGRLLIRVDGERVLIERLTDRAAGYEIHDLGRALVPNGEDIDIQLKFGLLEGRLVVHWRETFLHTTYRQGLFRIVGEDITPLCEGIGGVHRSH